MALLPNGPRPDLLQNTLVLRQIHCPTSSLPAGSLPANGRPAISKPVSRSIIYIRKRNKVAPCYGSRRLAASHWLLAGKQLAGKLLPAQQPSSQLDSYILQKNILYFLYIINLLSISIIYSSNTLLRCLSILLTA